tara:strand:+ start:132 stop:500 length:369 start_codon:yes stop_codon:yes gene_type:complete
VHNIAWLAAEFSLVKKGEVIARFDDESIQIQSRNKSNEFAMNEKDILNKNGELYKQLDTIIGTVKTNSTNFQYCDVMCSGNITIGRRYYEYHASHSIGTNKRNWFAQGSWGNTKRHPTSVYC